MTIMRKIVWHWLKKRKATFCKHEIKRLKLGWKYYICTAITFCITRFTSIFPTLFDWLAILVILYLCNCNSLWTNGCFIMILRDQFPKYDSIYQILTSTAVCRRHPEPSDGQLKRVLWTPTCGECGRERPSSTHMGLLTKETGNLDPEQWDVDEWSTNQVAYSQSQLRSPQ